MITLQPMNICQAAADLMWSRVHQEVPRHPVRALRGRHRLDPVLPRPARPHLRHAPRSGPVRTSATKLPSEVFREHFLTCFIDDPVGVAAARPHRHRQHRAGSATTRTPTRRGRTPPEELGVGRGRRRPTTTSTRSRSRTRCRWYSFDPFAAPHPRGQSTVGGAAGRVTRPRRLDPFARRRALSRARRASTSARSPSQATA